MESFEKRYEFIWRIENFNSNLPEIGNKMIDYKCLASPYFTFYMSGYTVWYLELYPMSGLGSSSIKCLPICKDYGKDYSVTGELSVIDELNNTHVSKKTKWNCSAAFHCDFSNALVVKRNKLPRQRDLILKFILWFNEGEVEKDSSSEDLEELSKDLHNFWMVNPTFRDLTLSVGENKMKVHRTILCIRAPKFAEDLGIQDGDCFIPEVKVSDMSFPALKILIMYLYTGKINIIFDDRLPEIYEVCNKYNLDHLKYELTPTEIQSTAVTKVDFCCKENLIWKISDYNDLKNPITRLVHLTSCCFIMSLIPSTSNSKLNFKMLSFPESNQIYLRCKMCIVGKDCSFNFPSDHIQLFESEKKTKELGVINKEKWDFPTLIQNSDLTSNKEKYLPLGTLTLQFYFETTEGERKSEIVETKSFSETKAGNISHLNYLKDDFLDIFKARNRPFVGGDYYDGDCYNDFTLKTDKKDIGCHKAVLCARSKVFHKLLQNNNKKEIKISNLDHETVLLMVQYIYSGKLANLAAIEIARLLIAGEIYEIGQLTRSCLPLLENSLTVQNVCNVVSLADKRNNDTLLKLASNYIKCNKEEVLNSDEWKQFVDKSPVLSTKIHSEICENVNRPREYFKGTRRPNFRSFPKRGGWW